MVKRKNNYYAYYIIETKTEGITNNWKDCAKKVKGVNARYKGFVSKDDAVKWLKSGAKYVQYVKKNKKTTKIFAELEDGIYFDAGTGRGQGVEIRVTDKERNSVLHEILENEILNDYGNYNLGKKVTNNFGELTACLLALQLAIKKGIKKVFGDSNLVIKYWSKGIYREGLPEETIKLIYNITQLRKEFEQQGGKLTFISGDLNPADLGFHRCE